jgi:hypothetical protein
MTYLDTKTMNRAPLPARRDAFGASPSARSVLEAHS